MKNFIIPPIKHQNLSLYGTQGLYCLAHHYLQHEEYRNFFLQKREEGYFIILDNGSPEGNMISADILIDITAELRPNEVIPPDVLFDEQQTVLNLFDFVDRMYQRGLFNFTTIFMCPQGLTVEEWIRAYKVGLEVKEVSTIGLSKIAVPRAFLGKTDDQGIAEARNLCVNYLIENDLLKKPLHLLGMGEPNEFIHYQSLPAEKRALLRSTDSCYTVLSAIKGFSWDRGQFTRIKTPHEYFDWIMTQEQVDLARQNILFLKNIIQKI